MNPKTIQEDLNLNANNFNNKINSFSIKAKKNL